MFHFCRELRQRRRYRYPFSDKVAISGLRHPYCLAILRRDRIFADICSCVKNTRLSLRSSIMCDLWCGPYWMDNRNVSLPIGATPSCLSGAKKSRQCTRSVPQATNHRHLSATPSVHAAIVLKSRRHEALHGRINSSARFHARLLRIRAERSIYGGPVIDNSQIRTGFRRPCASGWRLSARLLLPPGGKLLRGSDTCPLDQGCRPDLTSFHQGTLWLHQLPRVRIVGARGAIS